MNRDRISIRVIAKYSIDFFWSNQWISHNSWFYSEALRYAQKLQERGIVCKVERREWGHKGYWHIVADDTQTEAMNKAQAEDHEQWLKEWKVEAEQHRKQYEAALANQEAQGMNGPGWTCEF